MLTDFSDKERDHVGQEMADVFLYLVRLAEKCHVDLPQAVWQKIEKNAQKYPAHVVFGKNHKYTEYEQNGDDSCKGDS